MLVHMMASRLSRAMNSCKPLHTTHSIVVKMLNMEQIMFSLFWLWVWIRSFTMSYMSIVLTNQVEDNAVNNIMYDFVVVGGGNAIWRMLNRNCVTAVKRMLGLTNLSMVLSCSAVTLFSSAMAVIYQLLC
ncbi:hypothetical protein QL285_029959 [Trifolium repens]|nr:hypothetical protein QL285_029959 [Trifolium repens]